MTLRGCPGCRAWTNKLTLVGMNLISVCKECDSAYILEGSGRKRTWKPFNEEV